MKPEGLLAVINERHQTDFQFVERYQGGEQGAYAMRDGEGKRYVLKWGEDRRNPASLEHAATTTAYLRGLGYPAPLYSFVGVLPEGIYSIQEELPGTPLNQLGGPYLSYLSSLLELNAMQLGRAVLPVEEWPGEVIDTVLIGGDGYCIIETLRSYSTRTAELLKRLQQIVATHADHNYETRDIVHFDFHLANVLIEQGQVSGVIDWDATCSGDAGFDLATQLFYAYGEPEPELRRQLWQHGLERSGPAALSVYLAHMIVRQVDWSIRYHDPAVARHYIRTSGELLGDIYAYR